jgi:hypothetical protein
MQSKKLLFYLLSALLGGCIPVMSLHPLYTEKDVVFENSLLGTWLEDSNDTTWEFKRIRDSNDTALEFERPDKPEKAYKLIYSSNEDKTKGSFFVHLVKLENRFFLDVFPSQLPCVPQDPNQGWVYNSVFLLPVHTFIKVDTFEPQLRIRLTNNNEMEKLLKEQPNAVRNELVEDNIILTASTKELQTFVLKYAQDDRVFSDKIILTRKKAQASTKTDSNNPRDPNSSKANAIDPNRDN